LLYDVSGVPPTSPKTPPGTLGPGEIDPLLPGAARFGAADIESKKKAPGVPGLSKQMSIRKRLGIKCVKRPDPPLSVGGTGLAIASGCWARHGQLTNAAFVVTVVTTASTMGRHRERPRGRHAPT